jgi:predicted TIM-barrel fold metal-dependent hydrolase
MTRTITLEEHYASRAFLEGPGRDFKAQAESPGFNRILEQLCDLEEGRIADMDAAGIDVQVLSLTSPGVEQLDATEAVALAREENDRLAEAVRRHPGRFAGFAALPTPAPDTAADELERMVREHAFEGALINGHNRGRYLDDEFFWPILERAEALQIPIYLHPTPPPRAVIEASYTGNYAPEVTGTLANGAWG